MYGGPVDTLPPFSANPFVGSPQIARLEVVSKRRVYAKTALLFFGYIGRQHQGIAGRRKGMTERAVGAPFLAVGRSQLLRLERCGVGLPGRERSILSLGSCGQGEVRWIRRAGIGNSVVAVG